MFSELNEESPIILIDFGLSQFCDEKKNEKNVRIVGTLQYIGFL
jgi:hypothetical protein